jgi:hypothetical protein
MEKKHNKEPQLIETTSAAIAANPMLPAAYLFLKKYVQKYLQKNFDTLSEKYGITKNDLADLGKDKNSILEWVLGEHLDNNEFKELGVTIQSDWGIEDENTHTTIYKIGRKLIRSNFKNSDYMTKHNFDFVKPVKNKVIVYSYEVVA